MKRDFFDVMGEQRKVVKADSVQKSLRLSTILVEQLSSVQKRSTAVFGKNVTLSLLVRSILAYHLQVLQDLPTLEHDGKEVDFTGSRLKVEVSSSPKEDLVEIPVFNEEGNEVDEDAYILQMLGDTTKKAGRSWKP